MRDSEYYMGKARLALCLHNGQPYNFFHKETAKLDLCEEDNLAATYRAGQGDRKKILQKLQKQTALHIIDVQQRCLISCLGGTEL